VLRSLEDFAFVLVKLHPRLKLTVLVAEVGKVATVADPEVYRFAPIVRKRQWRRRESEAVVTGCWKKFRIDCHHRWISQ
jgi:hypothetical protein